MARRNLRCTSILKLLECGWLTQGRVLHGDRSEAWFRAQRAGVKDKDEDKDECASDASMRGDMGAGIAASGDGAK